MEMIWNNRIQGHLAFKPTELNEISTKFAQARCIRYNIMW